MLTFVTMLGTETHLGSVVQSKNVYITLTLADFPFTYIFTISRSLPKYMNKFALQHFTDDNVLHHIFLIFFRLW